MGMTAWKKCGKMQTKKQQLLTISDLKDREQCRGKVPDQNSAERKMVELCAGCCIRCAAQTAHQNVNKDRAGQVYLKWMSGPCGLRAAQKLKFSIAKILHRQNLKPLSKIRGNINTHINNIITTTTTTTNNNPNNK